MALPKPWKEKLLRALQEEESDLFILTMHYRNDGDLNYFSEIDRRRVKTALDILIGDTERHSKVLKALLGLEGG